MANHGNIIEQPRIEPLGQENQVLRGNDHGIVMVRRNQDADEVLQQVRHDNMTVDNKQGAPYACKALLPSNGKNPVELDRGDKFPKKTYIFDVTKCGNFFYIFWSVIVPPGAKVPLLEQRKKRGFCKYHNFLGHKTSQCFLFRDLVQKAIADGKSIGFPV